MAWNDTFYSGSGNMTITEDGGTDTVVFSRRAASVSSDSGLNIYDVAKDYAGGLEVISYFKVALTRLRSLATLDWT